MATPTMVPTRTGLAEGPRRTALVEQGYWAEGLEDRGLDKRWEGWNTTTLTSYVTNTNEVPTVITQYTTYGESPAVDGGTQTVTEYKGADTVTVLGPSYLTLTFYPTSTTYSKTTQTVPTTTKTKTKTQTPASTATICKPGDANVKEFTGLKPTHDQSITLYVIAIYIVGIAIGWSIFGLRELLYPFKLLTVAVHEAGHLLACICFRVSVVVIDIDPGVGGRVMAAGPDEGELPLPILALPFGYLFSIIFGGVMTFCGFDTLASKIASFIVGLVFIPVFFVATTPGKGLCVLAIGLMIGLWFVDHAWPLRFYILFVGVMNSFYVLWDVGDDIIFHKQNPSCPVLFADALGLVPMIMAAAWVVISFIFFILFVLAALATWKESPHAMFCEAQGFLPT